MKGIEDLRICPKEGQIEVKPDSVASRHPLPLQLFGQAVDQTFAILRPVQPGEFVVVDVAADHPVAHRQRGVDRPVDEGGALLVHLPDGIHERSEVQTAGRLCRGGMLAAGGCAVFSNGGFLLRWHGSGLLFVPGGTAEAVFNVVVQDEIQLLRREPVVFRQHRVDFVEDGF